MLKEPVSITALSTISALGSNEDRILDAYLNPHHFLTKKVIGDESIWVGELPIAEKKEIEALRQSDSNYKGLDDTVLFAIHVSRRAIKKAGWTKSDSFGINIGSSRGATQLFENYHEAFLENRKASILASPTTTLGNISSWIAHDLQTKGPVISHSITCSTALHAILNGIAWIQGGMTDKFLVGGSEAPLTPFTIAQMRALKIYSNLKGEYPCLTYDLKKKTNSMVLGEGAGTACLEKGNSKKALAKIIGVGYATEVLEHNVSISSEAKCFQDSMKMALADYSPNDVTAVVMHAPGTVKGDLSEFKAIERVFGKQTPFLTTTKWKTGHTFGASGILSIEMAILMLLNQEALPVPFAEYQSLPENIENVLINAVGFGGNAVSLLLSR